MAVIVPVPSADSSGNGIWPLGLTMEDLQKYFESHKDKRDFPGHTSKVHSVAWSCEGKWLASGSLDKTVGVFHLERSKLVSTWWSRDLCCSLHSNVLSTTAQNASSSSTTCVLTVACILDACGHCGCCSLCGTVNVTPLCRGPLHTHMWCTVLCAGAGRGRGSQTKCKPLCSLRHSESGCCTVYV